MVNDLRLVKKYILLFDFGVPLYVILALLVIVAGVVIGLYMTRKDRPSFIRNSLLAMFFGYLFFVLCTTVLFRESSGTMRYCLFPFWSYDVLNYKIIAQHILNVLMFIPIGFILGAILYGKRVIQVIEIGCLLSVIIEILQLITVRGVCNIDDVIHNTIGCAIGYGIYIFCSKIVKIIIK
jgi:glycopeptide antibiotics resistance protein